MKKVTPIVIVLIILGIVGFIFMNSQKLDKGLSTQPKSEQKENTLQGNVFTSIKDALTKSVSIKCEYPDKTGKTNIVSYIKNGAVRLGNISTTENNKGSVIMKNEKMWIWNEGDKKGMILSIKQPTPKPGEKSKSQSEEILADIEKNKQFCKTEIVADSLFTPPSDVIFTDFENMFQNLNQDMMKKVPSGIPAISIEPTEVQMRELNQ